MKSTDRKQNFTLPKYYNSETISTIKTAVDAGELDEHIEKASVKLRDGFTK